MSAGAARGEGLWATSLPVREPTMAPWVLCRMTQHARCAHAISHAQGHLRVIPRLFGKSSGDTPRTSCGGVVVLPQVGCLSDPLLLLSFRKWAKGGRFVGFPNLGAERMNLLFWNLNRNDNTGLIASLVTEKDVDVAMFAEHQQVDVPALARVLGPCYQPGPSWLGCDKVRSVMKTDLRVRHTWEETRFSVSYIGGRDRDYILAMTHLPDRRSSPNVASRLFEIRKLMRRVHTAETQCSCDNTVIIGDLNANPYDSELLQVDALNAIPFKEVLRVHKKRTWHGWDFKYLYNPVLNWLSESTTMYGSYYRATADAEPYWHCLDQVLVSPSLMDSISQFAYLRSIGGEDLVEKWRPKKKISDHLPLFVTIQ